MIINYKDEINHFFKLIFEKEKDITDIFINEKNGLSFRSKNNIIKVKNDPEYTISIYTSFFNSLSEIERELYKNNLSLDTSYISNENKRFRLSFYKEYNGNAIAIRVLNDEPFDINDLQIEKNIIDTITNKTSGLFIISGPTSSGKTTTMSSLINHIGNNRKYHIITIEDPVEYIYDTKLSIFSQREIGTEVKTYEQAIIDAMRANPNVIVVGEIREPNAAREALKARQTGHLVITTIHADSVINTIERFVQLFPKEDKHIASLNLSNTLAGIINLRLIKKNNSQLELLYENIFGTTDVLNKIREQKDLIQLRTIMGTQNIKNIDEKLKKLYKEGKIDKTIIKKYSTAYFTEDQINNL